MDFHRWVAEENEKFGLVDEDWEDIKNTAVLTFVSEENGSVKSTYKGILVFRHRDSEKTIMPGETWICSLVSKQTYYFARGLKRIDSAFMFELKKDQMDAIASGIWEKHRNILEPLMEEKYEDIINKKITQAVEETRLEYETEMSGLKDTIHDLEQKEAENKHIISSLYEKLNDAEVEKNSKPKVEEIQSLQGLPVYTAPAMSVSVRRDGPDSISCDMFNRPRYFVHLSADHRIIVVRPHEQGNVVCMNNTIVLEGLAMISSFSGPYDMVSEYNQIYGGIQIYL